VADVDPAQLNNLVQSTAHLLNTIDQMKVGVIILIVTLVVIVMAFVLVGRWMILRNQEMLERKKQLRAAELSGALIRLSTSMEQHTQEDKSAQLKLASALDSVAGVTSKMDSSITVLAQRASGQMTKASSLRQIRRQFAKEITPSICFTLERSLTENKYEERRQFVSQKVKTNIAVLLADTRQDMRGSPLAFNPDLFFTTYPDSEGGGERFVLCDLLWDRLEPLYRKNSALKDRLEEAFLVIQNTVHDYVEAIAIDLNAARPLATQDELYRTPSPSAGHAVSITAAAAKDSIPRRFLTPLPGAPEKPH
jgi:hypothetical protein